MPAEKMLLLRPDLGNGPPPNAGVETGARPREFQEFSRQPFGPQA